MKIADSCALAPEAIIQRIALLLVLDKLQELRTPQEAVETHAFKSFRVISQARKENV